MKKEIQSIINLENFTGVILAFLPLYLIKLSFLGMPLNLLEILILMALGWWLWEKRFKNPEWKSFLKNNETFFGLAGIIVLGLLLSTFFNGNLKAGFGIIKGWFIFPLILALISTDIFREKKSRALKFFYAGAFGVASLALAGFLLEQVTYDGRLAGLFNSPNYLAMYLAPALIIGAVLFPENRKKYALSLAVIGAAFYLTYSFAAWAAAAVILTGIFLLKGREKKTKKLLMLGLIFSGLLFLAPLKTDKANDLFGLDERSSLASRLMIWQSAGKIMADNPLWGIGPGNFQDQYLIYQKYYPPYLEWAVLHPHNLYLAFYLYSGIIGLASFLLLIFFWSKKILAQKKDQVVWIALGIIIYFLLHGLIDTTYFKNDLSVIFWLAFFLPL